MPDPVHRTIQEEIESYAAERRAQAGGSFDLPPQTRQVLRAEVARLQDRGVLEGGVGGWWRAWWFRVAVSAAAVVVLLAGWVWWGLDLGREATVDMADAKVRSEEGRTAERLAARMPEVVPPAVPPPSPAPVGPSGSGRPAQREGPVVAMSPVPTARSGAAGTGSVSDRAVPPVGAPRAVVPGRSGGAEIGLARTVIASKGAVGGERDAGAVSSRAQPAPSAPVPRSAPGEDALEHAGVPVSQPARFRAAASTLATNRPLPAVTETMQPAVSVRAFGVPMGNVQNAVQFVQNPDRRVERRNLNSPPALPVLNRFEMQATGDRLRVVDADGSVYEGQVRSAGAQEMPFLAEGTNRTLNQKVRIDGRLVWTGQDQRTGRAAEPLGMDMGVWLNNSTVQGRAMVGENSRFDLNALPQAPAGSQESGRGP